MPSPIHIDANVPIYAAGRPHPLKGPCQQVIRIVAASPGAFSTDAEVLQELLHYYLAGHNWAHGQVVFRAFSAVMAGRVEAILDVDVTHAAGLAQTYARLSARDLLHVALMQRIGAAHIVSADQDFDAVPGIHRLDPAHVTTWRGQFGL
jgi:predicted nucleic acid-binding protein